MQQVLYTAFGETNTLIHLIKSFNPYTDIENVHYYLAKGMDLEEALTMPVRELRAQITDEMWDQRIKSHNSMLNGVWK